MARLTHYLPEGAVFKENPNRVAAHQQPAAHQKRRPKTDWGWTAKMLYARPFSWAVIASGQRDTQLCRNINKGRILALPREEFEADWVRREDKTFDVYARVKPYAGSDAQGPFIPGDRDPRDDFMKKVQDRRNAWYDTHQRAWESYAQDNYPAEFARSQEAEAARREKEMFG